MKKKRFILTMTLTAGFLISGCGNQKDNEHKNHEEHTQQSQEESSHSKHTQQTANGDIQELTSSMDHLPAFLNKQPKEIAAVYAAAPHYKDVLESMPCYCGCGESAGHKNNYDCFIANNKEDGQIVWDDHGTKCGTCLEIAAFSMQQSEEGKSTLEIRNMIDEKYKDGYAKPTPTPMPAS